ncbi:MAG: TyeA family type III secretion system gatekeeper subunit [Puniceicoccales bacterium]|nr:TyeA family type III secretion system gatekeeper subunit [Puniceicoccales bacterium]
MSDKEQLVATRELVKLTQEAFVSSQQIMKLIDLFFPDGTKDLEVAIYILNQIIELVRNLPGKFFKDDQSQAQFLTTAQTKLDALILREEEAAGEAYLAGGNA